MKIGTAIIFIVLVTAAASPVVAHPLGNFSINQFSRIEVGRQHVRIRQILDIAEIPTFQLAPIIDANKNGVLSNEELTSYAEAILPDYLEKLTFQVDGAPVELKADRVDASPQSGAGAMQTLTFKWDLIGDIAPEARASHVVFRNDNYSDRIGWREVVVGATSGFSIYNSTAFGDSASNELAAYPPDPLQQPLDERSAEFSFSAGAVPEGRPVLRNRSGDVSQFRQRDRFAELIAVPEITPTIVAIAMFLAFCFGAFHAMSPGHGKAVVGAYLVGSRGTARHAVFLGLTVTITHTLGVFVLGFLTLFASKYILPERIMPFLSFVSGAIVLYIGLTLLRTRLLAALGKDGVGDTHHHHPHSHSHLAGVDSGHLHAEHINADPEAYTHTHDGHTHSHVPPDAVTWKGLLALGISGGLLPCPSALVLMLSAINLNRVGYGLVLTLLFSVGLASTLTLIGLIFLYGGRIFDSQRIKQSRVVRLAPVFSALVISCLGAWICYSSIG